VNEIENEPIFKGPAIKTLAPAGGEHLSRPALRQLTTTANIPVQPKRIDKPTKSFAVFTDRRRSNPTTVPDSRSVSSKRAQPPAALARSRNGESRPGLTKAEIEDMIERRVDQKFAEKALSENVAPSHALPTNLQKRLDDLEQRVSEKESSEGLQYLLMARQHQSRGEEGLALKMFQLAQPHFPNNAKLQRKIDNLEALLFSKKESQFLSFSPAAASASGLKRRRIDDVNDTDPEYEYDFVEVGEESMVFKTKPRKVTRVRVSVLRDDIPPTPRSKMLLSIVNSKDASQIRSLRGVGAKKAEAIVCSLLEMGDDGSIDDLRQLGALRGVGQKMVENMRLGL
jgi:hypothetical protein